MLYLCCKQAEASAAADNIVDKENKSLKNIFQLLNLNFKACFWLVEA